MSRDAEAVRKRHEALLVELRLELDILRHKRERITKQEVNVLERLRAAEESGGR